MFKKTVSSITSKLNATVAELEKHAEASSAKAVAARAAVAAAQAAHEAHLKEHDLAVKVAGNIKELLGG